MCQFVHLHLLYSQAQSYIWLAAILCDIPLALCFIQECFICTTAYVLYLWTTNVTDLALHYMGMVNNEQKPVKVCF